MGSGEESGRPRLVVGIIPVSAEAFVEDLHSRSWPSRAPAFDELDTLAMEGHPALAEFFVSVGRQLEPEDELAVSRLGAGTLQDWLWGADKRHPEALHVIADALSSTPALRQAIKHHMMMHLAELRSPAAQRLILALA